MKKILALTVLTLTFSAYAAAKSQEINCQNEAGYSVNVELDASKDLESINEENPAFGKIFIKNKEIVITDERAIASFYLEHELYITSEKSADLIIPQNYYGEEGTFSADIGSLSEFDDEKIEVSCKSTIK